MTILRLCFALTLLLGGTVKGESTRMVLVGDDIPRRLFIGSHFVFYESDSLYLNGRLLRRGEDYVFSPVQGSFDLSSLAGYPADTLVVQFEKLPSWLETSYGRTLPEIAAPNTGPTTPSPPSVPPARPPVASGVTLSGAKSFRFSARTAGASEFGQSLDLAIGGELAPGVTISGAVSDRGYDPSYGTANSRLNELDRVNLKLSSRSVNAQVGDIEVADRLASRPAPARSVSGAAFELKQEGWSVDGLAARPKGRFASARFMGRDGVQGPYDIGETGRPRPVVPGSETVWLDGEQLERGADKDYTVEYPTGRITFNVNHPIDSRRRIEIDFRPLAASYKGELLAGGGGAVMGDSVWTVELDMRRDGDDVDQPLWGEPTAEDRRLLAEVGDSVNLAVRSGVRIDSAGAYALIVDSLPDSVYRYVGADSGNYSVSFSFVGEGAGSYRFLGGDRYEYVGAGNGDYLPIVRPAAAERLDQFRVRTNLRSGFAGRLTAELGQSRYDRNLFSSLDDGNNDGLYYRLQWDRRFGRAGRENALSFEMRHRDKEYRTEERLNEPEFNREFLLPETLASVYDESLYRLRTVLTPARPLTVRAGFSRLEYQDVFRSNRVLIGAEGRPFRRLETGFEFDGIRARLADGQSRKYGDGDRFSGRVRYSVFDGIALSSAFESDNRKHDYFGAAQGTRYRQYDLGLQGRNENLRFEDYREDSLTGHWSETFRRRRAVLSSNRSLGELSYQLSLSHQWIDLAQSSEKNFLGRLGYRYHHGRNGLSLEGVYVLSTETRNARGITYLEVEPGRGDFSLDDGDYVPDPDGNYIQVEQLLSDRSRVRRGERSFHFRREFEQVYLRFDSRIEEELLDAGTRRWYWIVPFLTDRSQPYLFYDRRYDADLRLVKTRGFHVVNLAYSEDRQQRSAAGVILARVHREESLGLKQAIGEIYLEQRLELFQIERDQSYGGGGNVDGYRIGGTVRRRFTTGELWVGARYRQAESITSERSRLVSALFGARRQLVGRGEMRSELELYSQQLTNLSGEPSYLLTDNRFGKRGAVWSVSFNYGLKGDVRLNFSLSGRHSDDRTARVTGRGELVAGF